MKTHKLITPFLAALFFFITGCDKKLFDKRTKFIGDYDFQTHITCTPNLGDCDTTYEYSGYIDYSSDKDKVIIQYESNWSIEPYIDENDNLIQFIDHYQDDSLGRFINKNEVEFVIRSGGLGGGVYRNVYGKKK